MATIPYQHLTLTTAGLETCPSNFFFFFFLSISLFTIIYAACATTTIAPHSQERAQDTNGHLDDDKQGTRNASPPLFLFYHITSNSLHHFNDDGRIQQRDSTYGAGDASVCFFTFFLYTLPLNDFYSLFTFK